MKTKRNRIFVILLSFAMILAMLLTMISTLTTPSFAADGGWKTNLDGTISISDSEIDEVLSKNSNVTMVNIGTKGGSIVPSSLPNGTGIITETDSSNTVAMILYTSKQNSGTVKNMMKALKFSSATTQVHIDVSDGNTSISVDHNDPTFGILNSNGEAHAYKLVKYGTNADKSWFAAYNGAVTGAGTLGGMKGYLATVTTTQEATLLKQFYDSVSGGSTNGAWIAATSLKYSSNKKTNYNSAGKISPTNYGYAGIASAVSDLKITCNNGAYYCPLNGSSTTDTAGYATYYYWADGPEAGQQVPTDLWCSGEPNNSDQSRSGEYTVVASYNNNVKFNDFSPYNTNPIGYFLEFSTYDGGTAGGVNKNSYTISRVLYDGNGKTSGTVPATQAKVSSSNLILATNSGNLARTGYKFVGWNTSNIGTGTKYSAGGSYTKDDPITLYADWAPIPKITTQPSNLTMTYGYKNKTLSVAASVTDSHTLSYQWYSNTTQTNTGGTAISGATSASYTIPTTQKAGDYYYYCVVKGTRSSTNHGETTASNAVKVTINKATPTLSDMSATAITYGNKLSASTITGTAKHPESGTTVAGTWTFTNPETKPNAGTASQSVTFTPNDTANYNTATGAASVTVNKATLTPAVTMEGWTYGGEAKSPVVTGNPENGAETFTYYTNSGCTTKTTTDNSGAATTGGKPVNAGTYYVKAEVATTANYLAGSATTSFTIAKANIGEPVVSMSDFTYGGPKPNPSISEFPGGGTVIYRINTVNESSDGAPWSLIPANLAAGTYYMYADVAETANYNSYTTATKMFKINKADITPTVTQANWLYGNAASAPVIGGNPGDGAVTLTYYTDEACTSKTTVAADGAAEEGKQPVYAGTYYVKAQVAETSNYNGAVTEVPASFTIEKRPVTVNGITTTDKTYDGKTSATLDYSEMTLTGKLANDDLTAVADGVFVDSEGKPDKNVGENKTVALTNLRLSGNSKGNYKLAEEGQQANVEASIKILRVDLQWAETSLVYNGKEQGPTATVGNIKSNDEDVTDDVTVVVEGQETNAGVYTANAVRLEGDDASNYLMPQVTTRAFNIAKADATIDIHIDNWTYGDEANEPTVTTVPSGLAATVEYKLQSEKNSEYREWGDGPTKAGIYNIRASVSGNDNYNVTSVVDTFIIGKRIAELEWSGTTFTYDGDNHMPTATVANIVDGDTCNVTVTGAATAPGTHTATAVKFTGAEAANYEMPDEHSTQFTISKADHADADVAVTIEGWTYGDTPNVPEVSGNTEGANVTYEYKAADAEDSEYTNKTPTNAGDYVVKATIAATAGYNEKSVTETFTISKRNAVLKWGNTSFKWNGEEQVPSCEIKNLVSGDECEVIVEGAEEDAGTYTATAAGFTGAAADNYAMPTSNSIAFTISKNALVPTVTIEGWTYGEEPEVPVVNGNEGGGDVTFEYKNSDEADSEYTDAVPTEAGTYVVKANIAATDGHDAATATAEFTIEKKIVGLRWSGISFTYDGKSHAPSAAVTNAVEGDELEVTVTGAEKNAGEHAAAASKIMGDKAANYELPSTVSQTYVIAKAPLTIRAKSYTIDLGDPAPEYEADITGFAEGEDIDVLEGSLKFDCEYTEESDAGTYAIEPDGVTDDNYDISFAAGTLTVKTSKAEVTLEPQASSGVYNGRVKELVTLGKAKNGTIYYRLGGGKWSTKIPQATKAGEYTVTWYLKPDENYTSDSSAAEPAGEINVTIEKRELEFTWGNNEFIYNGKDQCPELTIGNVAEGDSIEAEVSGEATAVGYHTARVTGISGTNASCYKMPKDRTCRFVITKANTPDPSDDQEGAALSIEGWTYGDTPNVPEVSGNVSGANITYKYKAKDAGDGTYSSKAPKAAGEYTVKATIAGTDSYNEKILTKDFTISKRTAVLRWSGANFTYDGNSHAPEATVANAVSGDELEVTVSGAKKNAGEYEAAASKITGDMAASYELPSNASKTYAIAKAPLTISAKNYTIEPGDPAPEYEADITGFVEGESASALDGTLSFDCPYTEESGAGTYSIEPKGVTSGNYDITFKAGTLTVKTGKAVVTIEPKAASKVYDGKAHELVTAGEAKNGSVYYRLGSGRWSTKIPEATKAGEYTVTWYLKADENYTSESSASDPAGEINVTIEKRELEFTWGNNEFVYNGKDQCPELTIGNVAEGDSIEVELSGEATAVGSHTAKATGISGTNYSCYKMPKNRTCQFVITKANTPDPSDDQEGAALSIEGWTYGDTPNVPEVSGNVSGANVTYKYKAKDAGDGTYSSKAPKAAGEYTVKATIAGTDSYNEKILTKDFTIEKLEAELIWSNLSFTYDGKEHAPTAVIDNRVNGDKVTVEVEGAVNVGKHTAKAVKITGEKADCYQLPKNASQSFEIKKTGMKYTASGWSGVCDGKSHGITVSVSEPKGAVVTYGKSSDSINLKESPAYKAEGSYTVFYKITADNYDTVTGIETVFIDKNVNASKRTVLVAKGIANGATAVDLSWNNVNADRYLVYFGRCNHGGKEIKCKKIKAVNGKTLKFRNTKLAKNTAYKFYVVAQKKSGGSYKTIATSSAGHFFTGNVSGKYTNPKALTLSKTQLSLKVGKTATIKGSVSKVKSGKALGTSHAKKLRFVSNNPSVATVNASGKVTAKHKGTCIVYVQTINGIWKLCKITVH